MDDIDGNVRTISTSLPKTATNMPQYIVLGLILMLISMMMFILQHVRSIKKT